VIVQKDTQNIAATGFERAQRREWPFYWVQFVDSAIEAGYFGLNFYNAWNATSHFCWCARAAMQTFDILFDLIDETNFRLIAVWKRNIVNNLFVLRDNNFIMTVASEILTKKYLLT
jgi:hypothetical protein